MLDRDEAVELRGLVSDAQGMYFTRDNEPYRDAMGRWVERLGPAPDTVVDEECLCKHLNLHYDAAANCYRCDSCGSAVVAPMPAEAVSDDNTIDAEEMLSMADNLLNAAHWMEEESASAVLPTDLRNIANRLVPRS